MLMLNEEFPFMYGFVELLGNRRAAGWLYLLTRIAAALQGFMQHSRMKRLFGGVHMTCVPRIRPHLPRRAAV